MNMAARIARQSYLSVCCGGFLRITRLFIPNNGNITSQPSVTFGSGHSDDTQDNHVHIPLERLTVSYSRSSGPGGQHVNKANTKAQVRFHLNTAAWIPQHVREKIFEKNQNRINKAGELLVTSELSRSRHRNLSDCVHKISVIIAEASEKPQEPSAEDMALWAARREKKNKERLKQKRIHSTLKQSRRIDLD